MESKSEVIPPQCCIACLKDEQDALVKNHLIDEVTDIYNLLVRDEVRNLLSLTSCKLFSFFLIRSTN